MVALEGTYVRRHLHHGWDATLPLIPTVSSGTRITVDQKSGQITIVAIGEGRNKFEPEQCVAALGLRPLFFSIAWKVLDFEVESALAADFVSPDKKSGWSIDFKRKEAKTLKRPTEIGEDAWRAVMTTYERTSELRHSLVHRRTGVREQDGFLVGQDANGGRLRPMFVVEQEAFGRVAQLSASLIIKDRTRWHVERDLLYQLHLLSSLHKHSLAETTERDEPIEVAVILDPDPDKPGIYQLHLATDLVALKATQPDKKAWEDNLILLARQRPEIQLEGCLEDAPDGPTYLDFDNPPSWLTSAPATDPMDNPGPKFTGTIGGTYGSSSP